MRFADAGHQLFLVGGSVRDLMLGRPSPDLDFATSAHPDQTTRILRGWAERRYLVGVRFGTVGAMKDGERLEITTFRQEVYSEEHRKPTVTFGDDVETDLSRRDFTINAMAVRLPDGGFVDPHGGVTTPRRASVLDTPLEPEVSFGDDPLRMLRAARFVSQLGRRAGSARGRGDRRDARAHADRLGRAHRRASSRSCSSATRVAAGLALLVDTRLADASCPSSRRSSWSRTRCTITRTCCATPTRWWRAPSATAGAAARGAAARRRQARHPPDHARGRAVPPPRGGRRADGREASAGVAIPEPRRRRRAHARRDAPAVPRVRRRVDATPRCAATCATPDRCSTS